MTLGILFDVAPNPPPVAGKVGLPLLLIIVIVLAVALILGFVLLLKRIQRRRASTLAANATSARHDSTQ